jgi:hypothetical protein
LVAGGHHPRHVPTFEVPGIGISKAEQIFYRAQTTYLLPTAKLLAARDATMQAAADLYSQSEVTAVGLAWAAVGVGTIPASVGPGDPPPAFARILDASPNPFNPSTRIRLSPAQTGDAVVRIYDSSGRVVRELIASGAPGTERSVTWDGRDSRAVRVPSGIYFIRLAGSPEADAVRVSLLK